MPAGLQCFDAQGRLILDVTDRMGRVVGSVLTGNTSGSVVADGMSYGSPWFMLTLEPGQSEGYYLDGGVARARWRPSVTINGQTISWTAGVPSRITFGVY